MRHTTFLGFNLGYIAVGLAVLLVAACTSTQVAETPAQRLFALQGEYNIALRSAAVYTNQPACSAVRTVACHDPAIKAKIIDSAHKAKSALKTARAALKTAQGGSKVAVAAVAVQSLTSYLLAKGIVK